MAGNGGSERYSGTLERDSAAGRELKGLVREDPEEVNWEWLSRDFGVMHPVFTQTYAPELIDVKPFPALGGNYNRLMGECWDSGNLYWARLADEMGESPVLLNRIRACLIASATFHAAPKLCQTIRVRLPVLESAERRKARMRYCPICKAEYRPEFRQCSDCLADLVDSLEVAEAAKVVLLWEGLRNSKFEAIVAALRDANIPNRAKSATDPANGYSFNPFARKLKMFWQVFVLEADYEKARNAAQSYL